MRKETITYVDLDGVERTEDFRFSLTKTELAKWQLEKDGGMLEYLQKIINAKDSKRLSEAFDEIIARSYGEKSEDGRRFVKSPELSKNFMETPAYDILYMKLISDAEFAASFMNDIVPATDKNV